MAIEQIDPATVTGGSALVLVLAGYARKFYMDWMRGRPEITASGTMDAQFKVLREQLEGQQNDNRLLRLEFNKMDVKLHRQQTKLTRTEMLVRQFVGLMREHNIEVPKYMQDELDDLLKPDKSDKPDKDEKDKPDA